MLQKLSREFLGQACAVVSALACGIFVVWTAWFNPYTPNGPGLSLPLGALLVLAVLASVAGLGRRPGPLLAAFTLSFLPMGLYLLGSPSIFAGIGIAHLGYLLGAVLIMIGAQRSGALRRH